jgi:hypothetical protein
VPNEDIALPPNERLSFRFRGSELVRNMSATGRHFRLNRVNTAMREPVRWNLVRPRVIDKRARMGAYVFKTDGAHRQFVHHWRRHVPGIEMIRLLAAPQEVQRIADHGGTVQEFCQNLRQLCVQSQIPDFRFIEKEIVDFYRSLECLGGSLGGARRWRMRRPWSTSIVAFLNEDGFATRFSISEFTASTSCGLKNDGSTR